MSHADYQRGIDFINKTAGTPGERKMRLEYWIKEAAKLIGKEIPDFEYA